MWSFPTRAGAIPRFRARAGHRARRRARAHVRVRPSPPQSLGEDIVSLHSKLISKARKQIKLSFILDKVETIFFSIFSNFFLFSLSPYTHACTPAHTHTHGIFWIKSMERDWDTFSKTLINDLIGHLFKSKHTYTHTPSSKMTLALWIIFMHAPSYV